MPSQNMLDQPVECESPTQGASVIPACLVNKFTPISPTKYKSSDEVITLYKDYKNTKDIGKLAIALAKYTYFESSVMAQSTFKAEKAQLHLILSNYNIYGATSAPFFHLWTMPNSTRFGISASIPLQDVTRLYDL